MNHKRPTTGCHRHAHHSPTEAPLIFARKMHHIVVILHCHQPKHALTQTPNFCAEN